MNFKKILCILFIVLAAFNLKADYTVNGFVTDAKTGEALIGVSVYSFDKKIGGVTNNYGHYTLTFPSKRDSVDLYFSYIGYKTTAFKIKLIPSITLNVQLEINNEIKQVEIVGERKNETLDNPQVSRIEISASRIKRIPAILGEPDVIKVIQLQPGVQKGSEAGTGLYVRGGGNDQNLILLDGAPLYNVSHTFNFFSVFNTDAINYVSFYKGGFPSRFGERLSSVLDITMKEGNSKRFSGSFSLGTVSARMMLEGPLSKTGNTTFMVSVRRTYLDKLIQPIFKILNNDSSQSSLGYYFYDVNFKLSHRISQNDRVFFSFYKGMDNLYSSFKETINTANSKEESTLTAGMKWGNTLATMRWSHIFNKKTFANFMVDYTGYKTKIYLSMEDIFTYSNNQQEGIGLDFLMFNGIRDFGAKADFDYVPNSKHTIKFGGNYVNHQFTPSTISIKFYQTGFLPFDTTLNPSRQITSNELAFYIEDETLLKKNFKVNYGLRLTSLIVDQRVYAFPEPRISGRYVVSKKWTLKASYAMVHQYLQRILISNSGLPLDYWAPSTKYIKPQASQQVVFSSNHSLKNGFELIAETYYKFSNNINVLKSASDIFNVSLNNWETNVEQGIAHSFGLELLLQKKFDDRWSGWIGYTLSKSIQRFPTVNFNNYFPTDFDRRHDLTLVVLFNPGKKWSSALTVVYATGQPFTLATGKYFDVNGNLIYEFSGRNNVRLPNTKRVDLSFTRKYDETMNGQFSFDLSFYNVLFAANPSGAVINQNGSAYKAYYNSFIPFMVPALSLNYKF